MERLGRLERQGEVGTGRGKDRGGEARWEGGERRRLVSVYRHPVTHAGGKDR